MLKIGNLKLKSKFILAPMAGISDLPFRILNRQFGAELAFTEMLNVRSISYKSKKTKEMLSTNTKDRPLGIQILGCEPKFILRALEVINQYKFDVLDFNAACPVKKVVTRGEGAGLLKDPAKLQSLLLLIKKNIKVPLTLKIRTGWDQDSVNAKEIALLAQDAGINALFIHGRTRAQGYTGEVDYPAIRMVKSSIAVPVIASGDIFSGQLAKKMFDETDCDGVVIARGALGNPWIFKAMQAFFGKRDLEQPARDEIAQIMLLHLDLYMKFYPEKVAVMKFRKFFAWYTKGFRKIRPLREKSSRAKNREDMVGIIQQCLG